MYLLQSQITNILTHYFKLLSAHCYYFSRRDLSLKGCQLDTLLVTGALSPYAGVVEKLYRDQDKNKVTILKVERAGDVLTEAVGICISIYFNDNGYAFFI